MPFGLTNVLATFQTLMNEVFASFLIKFVLVFFEDILVYSCCIDQHLEHLKQVLQVLRQHKVYAKKSKCSFGQPIVEYLGHIIIDVGV